jgi:hypothetical protein
LQQRLNRALEKEGVQLKKTRGQQAQVDLGDYYLIDMSMNAVVGKDIDLEKLGRKHKVLAAVEELVKD